MPSQSITRYFPYCAVVLLLLLLRCSYSQIDCDELEGFETCLTNINSFVSQSTPACNKSNTEREFSITIIHCARVYLYTWVCCVTYLCVVCKSLLASFFLPYASLYILYFTLSPSLSLSLHLPLPPPSHSLLLPSSLFLSFSLISPLLLLVCLFLV